MITTDKAIAVVGCLSMSDDEESSSGHDVYYNKRKSLSRFFQNHFGIESLMLVYDTTRIE